jgi:hypothetical protein
MPTVQKMRLSAISKSLNIASSTSTKWHFKTFRRLMSSQAHSPTQKNTSDFDKDNFFEAKNAENIYAWPFDNLKPRFIDFSKVGFRCPEGRL